eukprot:Colp12_sorted_trinity150504_noHs@26791
MVTRVVLWLSMLAVVAVAGPVQYPFQNWSLPLPLRVNDLVSRLTLEEQIQQTWSEAPAVERLGIKAYNWRSNCVHGWTANGGKWDQNDVWTNFPEPIGLGATFDKELLQKAGDVTATEGRALHNIGLQRFNGTSTEARGLNCFAPNVNLLRDPRWGRNQETFGEDPYLISTMGLAYTIGLQGGVGERYLKVAACAKHYAVHDGPENTRSHFIANVTLHDLFDTYLPQFRALVQEGDIATVMCAYSGTQYSNNAPDCASPFMLQEVLRGRLGFKGAVISDNHAVEYVQNAHHFVETMEEAAAVCLNATCDSDLGPDKIYSQYLGAAVAQGLVSAQTVAQSVQRLMEVRFRLGDFDPAEVVPYSQLGHESLDTAGHRALNRRAARESLVLLKNHGILPLVPKAGLKIAVVGPNANSTSAILGNYEGRPSQCPTIYQAFVERLNGLATVEYAGGCKDAKCTSSALFPQALQMAKDADVIIAALGLEQSISKEGMDWTEGYPCDGHTGGQVGGLPGCQYPLLQQLSALGKPVILIIVSGSPMTLPGAFEQA